jgi:hypothetical protein
MAAIALRIPTVVPDRSSIPGGHCYIVLPEPSISVRDLIAEKVRAELRKARAGGPQTTSIMYLLPDGSNVGFGPLDEQLAIAQAWRSFTTGHFLLLCDGRPMVDLDEVITLTRRSNVLFLCPNGEPEVVERKRRPAA